MAKIDLPKEAAALAEHLQGLNDEKLSELAGKLDGEFDEIYGDGTNAKMDLGRLEVLTGWIQAATTEVSGREADSQKALDKASKLRESIRSVKDSTPEDEGDAGADGTSESEPDAGSGDAGTGEEDEDAVEGKIVQTGQAVESLAASLMAAIDKRIETKTVPVQDLLTGDPSLNRHLRPALGRAAGYAPEVQIPVSRPGTVFAASTDIPGFQHTSKLDSMELLARAVHEKAQRMPISNSGDFSSGLVASMTRDFRHRLDLDSTPEQIDQILRDVTNVDDLIAAGGWCAPSEISYDFYNIICEDGILDLPSVGVLNRGGFRFPVSPTMATVTAQSPDGLWTWTETDDQAAVTGSPIKDCVRIPCPTFDEVRLVCEGLCLTAGNLTDWAYPENTANYLRLLMAVRAKLTNARVIGLVQAASAASVTYGGPSGGFYGMLMDALELSAFDIRNKFGMCTDSMIEVIMPEWAIGPLRSDWARRTGIDNPRRMANELISDMDARNVRVQLIQDYQVRTSGKPGATASLTNWPTTMEFMAYPPGTFVRGQGMNLNLGVVRDSTLNQTNDHTAAWMEDCYAVAKVGHESRRYSVTVCADGTTGAANVDCG